MPLNGFSAITEGARIERLSNSCLPYRAEVVPSGNPTSCDTCSPLTFVQPPITPSESNRITALSAMINNTLVNGGCVSQSRARQLLAAAGSAQQYGSEGVRIAALQQATAACSADGTPNLPLGVVIDPCPPLPPPPAPPPRAIACLLGKNQRLGA